MNERIRELRKMKEMNQTEFGAKLGLSQRAVANMEAGGTVTERNFEAICKAFSVNPQWLRDGVGEVFVETRAAIIQSVVDEFGLSKNEAVLMRSFLELAPEHRAGVLKWAEKFTRMMAAQLGVEYPQRDEMPDNELSVEEMREKMNRELDEVAAARKRGTTTSSASTTTNGLKEKFGIKS